MCSPLSQTFADVFSNTISCRLTNILGDLHTMHAWHASFFAAHAPTSWLLVVGAGLTLSCFAPGDSAHCDEDKPCLARGQVCDLDILDCVPTMFETDKTGDAPGTSFMGIDVPFFRGQICTVLEAKTGVNLPVTIKPCMHPCLTSNEFQHWTYYRCEGGRCDATLLYWNPDMTGTSCPPDVFGQFANTECVYDMTRDVVLGAPKINGSAISATYNLEVPFLSNADLKAIIDYKTMFPDDETGYQDLVFKKRDQYPQDQGRVLEIQFSPSNNAQPSTCDGGQFCECYDIGFE